MTTLRSGCAIENSSGAVQWQKKKGSKIKHVYNKLRVNDGIRTFRRRTFRYGLFGAQTFGCMDFSVWNSSMRRHFGAQTFRRIDISVHSQSKSRVSLLFCFSLKVINTILAKNDFVFALYNF